MVIAQSILDLADANIVIHSSHYGSDSFPLRAIHASFSLDYWHKWNLFERRSRIRSAVCLLVSGSFEEHLRIQACQLQALFQLLLPRWAEYKKSLAFLHLNHFCLHVIQFCWSGRVEVVNYTVLPFLSTAARCWCHFLCQPLSVGCLIN